MNISANLSNKSIIPFSAVVLHQSPGSSDVYGTKHRIEREGGAPRLLEGSLLTVEDLSQMLKALQSSGDQVRWLDSQILAAGSEYMLWYSPPKMRPMFFESTQHMKCAVKGQGLLASPGLVWLQSGSKLYVFATQAKGRPEKADPLYQAPFWNVWSSGEVCVGNAIRPQGSDAGNPDAWEQMFFGSKFTHPNFSELNRLLLGDPVAYWAQQLKRPNKSFPVDKLVPLGLTVGDIATSSWKSAIQGLRKAQGEF